MTPPEFVEQFNYMFTYEGHRPDIEYFVCTFESLVDPINDRKPNKVKLKVSLEELPFDMKFYV